MTVRMSGAGVGSINGANHAKRNREGAGVVRRCTRRQRRDKGREQQGKRAPAQKLDQACHTPSYHSAWLPVQFSIPGFVRHPRGKT